MTRLGQRAGWAAVFTAIPLFLLLAAASPALAREYAAMVMDARTGKVLHSRNADTRLHPASLTKMMTLYIAFEAVERGEISLDTKVTVSKNAAAEPASKLYLKAGQRIELRYLIRAAAVKSANDAATAIGEAIEGSEAAFAARMTRTAKALGMNNTTFKNAHGLTRSGHLSTARDMSILGRHLFYDYPDYYNLFSRRTTNAGVTEVANTNRRLLNAYRGADGIKTGYTNAAGSNLVASAERGGVRIIATMFGGSSSAARNKRVAQLLDMGFERAPRHASVQKPGRPNYAMAEATKLVVRSSPLPRARPASIVAMAAAQQQVAANLTAPPVETPTEETDGTVIVAEAATGLPVPAPRPDDLTEAPALLANADDVAEAALDVDMAQADIAATDGTQTSDVEIATAAVAAPTLVQAAAPETPDADMVTMRRNVEDTLAAVIQTPESSASARAVAVALTQDPVMPQPEPRPARVTFSTANMASASLPAPAPVVVSTSGTGTQQWGVSVGRFNTRWQAERVMLRTALQQVDLLRKANRQVVSKATGFEVQFVGLSKAAADLTCQRLSAKDERCASFGS